MEALVMRAATRPGRGGGEKAWSRHAFTAERALVVGGTPEQPESPPPPPPPQGAPPCGPLAFDRPAATGSGAFPRGESPDRRSSPVVVRLDNVSDGDRPSLIGLAAARRCDHYSRCYGLPSIAQRLPATRPANYRRCTGRGAMRQRHVYSLKLERVDSQGIEATCAFVVNVRMTACRRMFSDDGWKFRQNIFPLPSCATETLFITFNLISSLSFLFQVGAL